MSDPPSNSINTSTASSPNKLQQSLSSHNHHLPPMIIDYQQNGSNAHNNPNPNPQSNSNPNPLLNHPNPNPHPPSHPQTTNQDNPTHHKNNPQQVHGTSHAHAHIHQNPNYQSNPQASQAQAQTQAQAQAQGPGVGIPGSGGAQRSLHHYDNHQSSTPSYRSAAPVGGPPSSIPSLPQSRDQPRIRPTIPSHMSNPHGSSYIPSGMAQSLPVLQSSHALVGVAGSRPPPQTLPPLHHVSNPALHPSHVNVRPNIGHASSLAHDQSAGHQHPIVRPPNYERPGQRYEGAGGPGPTEQNNSVNPRPLNVKDALSYLDQVKLQFAGQPEVYNRFLDIMKDFKSQEIDTPGVIERVSTLFRSQPRLIIGFNTFLPPGYSLEPTNNPADPVRVTTPANVNYNPVSLQPLRAPEVQKPVYSHPVQQPAAPPAVAPPRAAPLPIQQPAQPQPAPVEAQPRPTQARGGPVEFNHAINYVNKIKTRFANQPETYRYFLEILQTYQKDDKPIKEVYAQVQYLFAGAPDLLEEFKQFLPDTSAPIGGAGPSQTVPNTAPKKVMKRVVPPPPSHYYSQPPVHAPPKKKAKVRRTDKPTSAEEVEFFDKCKRVIGNKTTYNEFLKVLNLYTLEIIEAKVLIERVEPFLAKSPELFEWFKRFVKYDDDDLIYNIPADKVNFDVRSCRQSGHSYRKLPTHVPRPFCSGRDELARDVLNDDWVGLPVFLSENGFMAHKKTPHEESMFKCEEERYEFDLNIEANLSVINLLEPIAKKIQMMPPEERANFKVFPGLGGFSTTIYKRVIKKVYDTERGYEVIEALHQNPAVAVPIVLKRLKQKDEEWRRSQREWNKAWREIDHKNFSKALDHQGINFKITDRKSIVPKYLITEIEVLQHEQAEKKSNLANRYQFDFSFKDKNMFRHIHQVLLNYVETSATISSSEEGKIRALLTDFVPSMFLIEPEAWELAATAGSAAGEDGAAMDLDQDMVAGPAKMDVDTPAPELLETPLVKKRTSHTLYANNTLYAFFRLYQMLYSRLLRMKQVSDKLQGTKSRSEVKNQVAIELGLRKESSIVLTEKDRFTELVKIINVFANNEMESSEFEDKVRELFWTSGYIIFTVDKLIQALVKQLQTIAMDSKCSELLTIYSRDREKPTTGPRQEALFRLCAEQIVQDENIYRIEFFFAEKLITIQVLGKEDQVTDEAISSEEKWSLYVDQFVQLSTADSPELEQREPFLNRNLPRNVGEDPPLDVETKSGLELKICVNTYKIFFVDNTEDYFWRKRRTLTSSLGLSRTEKPDGGSKLAKKRLSKFSAWLESENGWRSGLTTEAAAAGLAGIKKLFGKK